MRREPTFTSSQIDEWVEPDEFDTDDEPDFRRLKQAQPGTGRRLATRFVCAAAIIAGLTVLAKERAARTDEGAIWTEPPTAKREPVPKVRETPLLAYEGAESDPPIATEKPRWNAGRSEREDTLTLGGFDAIDAPYLRITLVGLSGKAAEPDAAEPDAAEPDAAAPGSLFVQLARRAAQQGGLSVLRTGRPGQVETKFGPFETVETTLSGEGTRQCTGFRRLGDTEPRLDGWLCGLLGQATDMRAVTCAVDRLKLAGPAPPALTAAFAEADKHREPACGGSVAGKGGRSADATGSIAADSRPERGRQRKIRH